MGLPSPPVSQPPGANKWVAAPRSGLATGTASILNNAQNTNIMGGQFNITTYATNFNESLDAVHKRVASNAILNAGGRADEPRCHPGTREAVISRIEKWRDAQDSLTPPIFWLSGPAGAGKTAIVQTIAERCKAQSAPHANFFFFRTDTSRNSLSPFIATLVHQIILFYPDLRDAVAAVLCNNPLILDSILKDQLVELIVKPLQVIQQSSSPYSVPVLLIDGLDECESEDKRSQRQILHAFDTILTEYTPSPFRLLVASRDESQIRVAFNNISCQLLPLYLDDQFSPDADIRSFVTDEFQRVLDTHPLSYMLDTSWPSVEDVEDIVQKSSGQFIYAATVMRFILESAASPILSLAMVQGAAPVSTKSPFAYLDAIYTYILSEVDDQEALKDILHAELLIRSFSNAAYRGSLVQLLEAYNPRYSNAVVQSCLADLTPIIRYNSVQQQLLFYHASFPDYLLDPSRSYGYFVDADAFNAKSQPAVWKTYYNFGGSPRSELQSAAFTGLAKLTRIPSGFLDTLMTLEPSFFDRSDIPQKSVDFFKHIHSLCTSDDDVIKYKQILRKWVYTQRRVEPKLVQLLQPIFSDWPPCSYRYLAMAQIEDHIAIEPLGNLGITLRPETDSDHIEITLWLRGLLCRIHREIYHKSVHEYNDLLQKWTFWATQNDIPLDDVDYLPKVRWYCARERIQQDISIEPNGRIDVALRPETDSDAREIGLWLENLLHRIYREKYHSNNQEYTQLLQKWTSWATHNGIALDRLDNLPKAQWYCALAYIEHHVATEPSGRIGNGLRPNTDAEALEIGVWLDNLLHRIHREKYHTNIQEYDKLLRTWMSWATWNNIPLDRAKHLPKAQWYLRRSRIQIWFASHLKFGSRPE